MLLRWFLMGVKGQNGQIAWLALLFALAGLELRIWIGIGLGFHGFFLSTIQRCEYFRKRIEYTTHLPLLYW
jgi:hypothetical protein